MLSGYDFVWCGSDNFRQRGFNICKSWNFLVPTWSLALIICCLVGSLKAWTAAFGLSLMRRCLVVHLSFLVSSGKLLRAATTKHILMPTGHSLTNNLPSNLCRFLFLYFYPSSQRLVPSFCDMESQLRGHMNHVLTGTHIHSTWLFSQRRIKTVKDTFDTHKAQPVDYSSKTILQCS